MPVNTIYPNIPENFIDEMIARRIHLGLSQRKLSAIIGLPRAAINQFENRSRNISRETAVKIRDALRMDIELPEVIEEQAKALRSDIRKGTRNTIQKDEFFVRIDGDVIKVLRWILITDNELKEGEIFHVD